MAEPPDLTPDVHVGELLASTDGSPDLVRLIGYLGAQAPEGYVRLYVDAALTSWMDLRKADIVRRDRIVAEDGTVGGRSAVYVRGEAMRRPVRLRRTEDAEVEFLSASRDIEDLVPDDTLADIAERASFLEICGIFARTFRTCKP